MFAVHYDHPHYEPCLRSGSIVIKYPQCWSTTDQWYLWPDLPISVSELTSVCVFRNKNYSCTQLFQ